MFFRCEACNKPTILMWEEIMNNNDRFAVDITWNGAMHSNIIRRKFICNDCYQNNWKFTEHGVLMNETPVTKKKKR